VQGVTGPTGATGPVGPTGPQGPPGTAAPAQQPLVRTRAQLSDIDDPINTDLKTTGLPVWDSTFGILLIASGPDPDDPWVNTLGVIVISFGDEWIFTAGVWNSTGIWNSSGIWQ
jgi:hypothetical protein